MVFLGFFFWLVVVVYNYFKKDIKAEGRVCGSFGFGGFCVFFFFCYFSVCLNSPENKTGRS